MPRDGLELASYPSKGLELMLKNNLRRGGIEFLQGEICPAASKKLTHFLIAPTVYSSTIMQNSWPYSRPTHRGYYYSFAAIKEREDGESEVLDTWRMIDENIVFVIASFLDVIVIDDFIHHIIDI